MNSVLFHEAYEALKSAIDEAYQEILVINNIQPNFEKVLSDDSTEKSAEKRIIEKKEISHSADSEPKNIQTHTDKKSIANAYAVELFQNKHIDFLLSKLKEGLIEQIRNSRISLNENDPIYAKIDAFSIIKWPLKEVPHTMMLAFFLDMEGNHGLGIIPMEYFLRTIRSVKKSFSITIDKTGKYTVEAEKKIIISSTENNGGRLDIYIDIPNNARLIIEGKVDSQEGKQQLKGYYAWGESEKKAGISNYYIYLTKEGDDASHDEWIPLSWKIIAYSFCSMLYDNLIIEMAYKNPDVQIALWLLRLWLATILHHVLKIPVIHRKTHEQMSISDLSEFSAYIQEISEFINWRINNDNK